MITSTEISKIRVSPVFWYLHITFCHLMIAPWHIRCVMLVNRFVNAHTHTPAILAPLTFSTNNKMKWANICACHNTCMMELTVNKREREKVRHSITPELSDYTNEIWWHINTIEKLPTSHDFPDWIISIQFEQFEQFRNFCFIKVWKWGEFNRYTTQPRAEPLKWHLFEFSLFLPLLLVVDTDEALNSEFNRQVAAAEYHIYKQIGSRASPTTIRNCA